MESSLQRGSFARHSTSPSATMENWHLWTIAGILLIIAEMLTYSFFAASFGVAALITAYASTRDVGTTWELGIFVIASALSVLAVLLPAVLQHGGVWALGSLAAALLAAVYEGTTASALRTPLFLLAMALSALTLWQSHRPSGQSGQRPEAPAWRPRSRRPG